MPIRAVSLCLASAFACIAMAQTPSTPSSPGTPSADQMIEQLRSPRTRSLRNLQVEAVTPPAASASAPVAAPSANASVSTTPAVSAANISTPAAASAAQIAEPKPQLSLLIQFDFDSARVRPESIQALGNLAAALQSEDLRSARFAIEGHTDAKGRADYNQRLSQLRADAVSNYLASQGVARERLQPQGKGASELANRADPSAAENRRVRIVNLD